MQAAGLGDMGGAQLRRLRRYNRVWKARHTASAVRFVDTDPAIKSLRRCGSALISRVQVISSRFN